MIYKLIHFLSNGEIKEAIFFNTESANSHFFIWKKKPTQKQDSEVCFMLKHFNYIWIINIVNCILIMCAFQDKNIHTIDDEELPHGITALVCHNNPLTQITRHAFNESANTLHAIDVQHHQLTLLPPALKDCHNGITCRWQSW